MSGIETGIFIGCVVTYIPFGIRSALMKQAGLGQIHHRRMAVTADIMKRAAAEKPICYEIPSMSDARQVMEVPVHPDGAYTLRVIGEK